MLTSCIATLTHYVPVHQSAVLSICWVRVPLKSADGSDILTEDPTLITTAGSDGAVKIVDTRECFPRTIVRNREVPHSSAYAPFAGSIVATDLDFIVKLYELQPASFGKGHVVTDTDGAALASI